MAWLYLSILALTLWGLWGFLIKIASFTLSPKSAMVYDLVGNVVILLILLLVMKFRVEFETKGVAFAILAGISVGLGSLAFIYALSKGKAVLVMAITALYPVITILLSLIFFKEPISVKQMAGIVAASFAFMLLSS